MYDNCKWLPNIVPMQRNETSADYLSRIYPIFTRDFINSHPLFNEKKVLFNTQPITNGYEEAFFHITHVDLDHKGFQNRQIDVARCECIAWIKEIIDHYPCYEGCCNGLKAWKVDHKIHILFEKERYLIVLRERGHEYQLVTAFKLNYANQLQEKLQQYEQYKYYPI